MKKLVCGVAVLALLFVSGCFDYEEMLVIDDNGSGTIQMKFAMDKAFFDQMEAMGESMGDEEAEEEPVEEMFSRSQIEQSLEEQGLDIELISFDSSETEESRIWNMKFAFKDISQIANINNSLSSEEDQDLEFGGDQEVHYAQQDDGTWLFERSLGGGESMAPPADFEGDTEDEPAVEEGAAATAEEEDTAIADDQADSDMSTEEGGMDDFADAMAEMAAQMAKMMEGLEKHKMQFSVTFPGKILESNATKVEGNTATWEYSLMELSSNPPKQRAVIEP